jgi:hypothetical protein
VGYVHARDQTRSPSPLPLRQIPFGMSEIDVVQRHPLSEKHGFSKTRDYRDSDNSCLETVRVREIELLHLPGTIWRETRPFHQPMRYLLCSPSPFDQGKVQPCLRLTSSICPVRSNTYRAPHPSIRRKTSIEMRERVADFADARYVSCSLPFAAKLIEFRAIETDRIQRHRLPGECPVSSNRGCTRSWHHLASDGTDSRK